MNSPEQYGPVACLHQGRPLLGLFPPLMTVRCYCVDGLMIDSGLGAFAARTLEWAQQQGVRRAVLTHHHEDHSGGAPQLREGGLPVLASAATAERVHRGFATHLYQRLVWGRAPRVRLEVLSPQVRTERHCFQVLPAPGHCPDQVVLYEPGQGWLFSGDAFLNEKIRYFRGDEDFAATVESLRQLTRLDFDKLFCAHRPRLQHGRRCLEKKLQFLLDLQGRVLELHQRGLPAREITRRLLGREPWLLYLFSAGDLSKVNLVRSILNGPRPRKA